VVSTARWECGQKGRAPLPGESRSCKKGGSKPYPSKGEPEGSAAVVRRALGGRESSAQVIPWREARGLKRKAETHPQSDLTASEMCRPDKIRKDPSSEKADVSQRIGEERVSGLLLQPDRAHTQSDFFTQERRESGIQSPSTRNGRGIERGHVK